MKKRNILILVFIALFSVSLLSGCTKTTTIKTTVEDKTINYMELVDKNNTYTFASSNNVIDYKENLSFTSSSFTLRIHYASGKSEDIDSGFTFNLYKVEETETLVSGALVPGNYKIHVVYENNPQDIYFTISAITLDKEKMTVSLDASYEYIPNTSIEPDPVVTFNNKTLVKDTDYTIEYASNASVGNEEGIVIINGLGIYTGSVVYKFNITSKEPGTVDLPQEVKYTYDGKDPRDTIQKDFKDVEGVDRVEYRYYKNGRETASLSDVGTYSVKVKFYMEYGYNQISTKTFTLTVEKFDISTLNVEELGLTNITLPYIDEPYTSTELEEIIKPKLPDYDIMVGLLSGDQYNYMSVSDSLRTGGFYIQGMGNYTGRIELPFYITPRDISDAVVLCNDDTYTGKEIRVSVFYIFSSHTESLASWDYDIEYSNNINAGQASYTITGKGNYTGTKTGTFTINKAIITPEEYYEWVDFTTLYYQYTGAVQELSGLVKVKDDVTLNVNNIFDITYKVRSYHDEHEFKNADNYQITAVFTIKNDNYSFPINGDTVPTSYEITSNALLDIKALEVTAVWSGDEDYEYTGEHVGPTPSDLVLKAGNYTLVEGVDYSIDSSYLNSVETGMYVFKANLLTSNFYMKDTYNNFVEFEYYIVAEMLKVSSLSITWPTVYKSVWGYNFYITEPGSVKLNGETLDSYFDIGYRVIPGSDNVNASAIYCIVNNVNYQLVDENNKKITDNEIVYFIQPHDGFEDLPYTGYTLINDRFASFKANNKELSTEEIEAIYNLKKVKYGDVFDITMKDGYKLEYLSSCLDSSMNKDYSAKSTSLLLTIGSDTDRDNSPYAMGDIANIAIKIYDDLDPSFYLTMVYLDVIRINVTSPDKKDYDHTPYVLTYEVYPQGYEVKVVVRKFVNGVLEDFSGDIVDEGIYRISIILYDGDPSLGNEVYRLTPDFEVII